LPIAERKLSHDILPPDFTEEEIEKIKHFESATARKEKKKTEKKLRRLEKHALKMNKRVNSSKN
ncbi:MAG: hypothetical protein KDD32_13970, partial [Bacteroidetes bacterium]|nr:hypothetical protein [Bacteroidota bacterium]